jgi:hypothetical protein
MDNQKYLGFYNGIIVQNNDPDYAGKVKVWVPHISPTVYAGWLGQVKEDKRFKFLGANVAQQFTMIVEELKQILPWADVALPLVNEGATGRYAAVDQYGSISDSNVRKYTHKNEKYNKQYSQNKDNIGEKPANLYEQTSTAVHDEFNNTNNNVNHVNPFANQYRPSSYSNCSKGVFGIPSVGAHVWVFFREGDVNFPVVCFASYGKMDWDSIYDSKHDYPGNSENVKEIVGKYNHNVDKYRSKYVLNQKGGTLEIINTDHNEKVKITHYSGSFKEFNNSVTSELATGNDQKLVLGDQYNTIKGNKNLVVNGDSDENIKGDRYVKVGNLNYNAFREWKSVMVESPSVPDTRQLFDIQRTDDQYVVYRGDRELLRFNSTQQSLGLVPAPNDVCSYAVSAFTNTREIGGLTKAWFGNNDTSYKDGNNEDGKNYSVYVPTNAILTKTPSEDAGLSKTSPSSMNGEATIDASKNIMGLLNAARIEKLFKCEEQMGIGGSEIKTITKDKVETVGLLFNDFGSIRIDSKGKYYASEMKISNDTSFVNKSPSPLIEYVHVDNFPGGSYTVTANNSYNLLVGAGGMNLKSFGGANIGGTITNISGEQINIGSRNEINIVCDKRLNISADIISLRQKHQKQIMVDSSLGVANNVIIGGKTYMEQEVFLHHVTAPREIQVTYPSVVFARPCTGGEMDGIGDAKMGTFTATIAGDDDGHGGIKNGGNVTITGFTCKESNPNSIICTSHNHNFDNIPLTMMDSNSAVREAAHKAEVDV